jgi:allophanate hydrolase
MPNKSSVFMDMNIAALHEAYRNKTLTPEVLIDDILLRCEHYADYNIWISLLSKPQLMEYINRLADKSINDYPLWGIPFAIKDNIDLYGVTTTAACPDYAYFPEQHAFVVEQLIKAGAIPIGKTNLDQFATGLVGTRSPYGAVSNAFDPKYISGGSSSGSAVAVALSLVSFALGTDTAGSGRVPAAFNNIIGTKPSRGLLSGRGVVPACLSLDCITFFTTTQADANTIMDISAVYDEQDTYSRPPIFEQKTVGSSFTVGIPKEEQLEFYGHSEYLGLFKQACEQLIQAGATLVTVDITPFINAAAFLYQGPWVAERYHAVGEFIDRDPSKVNPTVAAIIQGGKTPTAVDTFDGLYKMQQFKKVADALLATVDVMLMPTTSNHYTIDEMNSHPVEYNSRLGYYTNFMNLLDYSALAIPAGFTDTGLPFGITLFAGAFEDKRLQTISQRYLRINNWGMGATGLAMPVLPVSTSTEGYIQVAVCGAHLTGMPLNSQLTDRNSILVDSTNTSAHYQFYALAGGPPYRPGLKRVADGEQSEAIFVEVWAVPQAHFGSFVAGIPAPLGIGKLELANGDWVTGFICEPYGLDDAEDITHFRDWREYIKSLS